MMTSKYLRKRLEDLEHTLFPPSTQTVPDRLVICDLGDEPEAEEAERRLQEARAQAGPGGLVVVEVVV